MSEVNRFAPPAPFSERAHIKSLDQYREMYRESIEDPDGFWSSIAEEFYWQEKWHQVRDYDFLGDIGIRYFVGGKTNVSYNALDRHLDARGGQTAILWEGNEPELI